MNQKTLIALGAMVVIGVLAFFTMRAPEKGSRVGPPPRPIAAFKAADVKTLDIASGNGSVKVSLRNDGGTWNITAPGSWRADQQQVKGALDQLEKLQFGDLVTALPAKAADLEVSPDKGAHVVAKDAAGKPLLDAWLGKSVAGFTMLRPDGKDEVWQAVGIQKYTFAKDEKGLRDHAIFEFNKDDVTGLALDAHGAKLALTRTPAPKDEKNQPKGEATWKVDSSTVKVEPLDEQMANNAIQTLSTLRAGSFADDAKAADVGLAPPKGTVTVSVKGAAMTLLLGNTQGDDAWVQVQGKPQIYVVQKFTMERLDLDPVNFRDKTVVNVKDDAIAEIDEAQGADTLVLEHKGDKWSAPGKPGEPEADETKIKAAVGAFAPMKGERFAVGATPADTGLAAPTATVTLKLRTGATEVVKIGALKDGDYFVQHVGSPDVVLMKKFMIDRFLKKRSDLVKTAKPSGPPKMPHQMGRPMMPPGH